MPIKSIPELSHAVLTAVRLAEHQRSGTSDAPTSAGSWKEERAIHILDALKVGEDLATELSLILPGVKYLALARVLIRLTVSVLNAIHGHDWINCAPDPEATQA
jgi:hypothetical protein